MKFEGVDSREDAEAVRGTLYIPGDEARSLEEGEFWEHDVVGCTVVDVSDREIGTVTAVVPGTAQDLLEIESENHTHLVPLVGEIVVSVDTGLRRVVVDPPEGLFDP